MGDVDERAAGNPACPKCGHREVNKLAARSLFQCWQCGKCLDEFTTPLSPAEVAAQAAAAPPLPPAPQRPTEEEVMKSMARLTCPECKKPFTHQAWLDKHRPKCKGAGGAPAAKPSAKAKAVAARIRKDRGLPAEKRAPSAGGAGHLSLAAQELRAKRDELEEGIKRIDSILPRLEELEKEFAALPDPTSA